MHWYHIAGGIVFLWLLLGSFSRTPYYADSPLSVKCREEREGKDYYEG